ncbi:MAG: metalloregulator ArsR/SmtB family transcription factor [Gammaproteobacteria bacterium]|nr:metalloregulator ArsR/SmtB family transcription factor [Gammaproteobacteria bacterium]MDP2139983.1 metalloregulator ArsR/SmtB family transcription factor [Gammaproteobacteria bacterium]MDP2347803.1 metalloregulator ArsR/SmtB family transcription factor [Gammaproteobacteria bacterium]
MNSVELASLFKALSEPVRVRVMALLLSRDELCVCDLVEALALPQSVVSRHLAYLRNHDLVTASRRGVWMYYQISSSARNSLAPLLAMLSPAGELSTELSDSLSRLEQDNCCI